jgi:hypothetical protein
MAMLIFWAATSEADGMYVITESVHTEFFNVPPPIFTHLKP